MRRRSVWGSRGAVALLLAAWGCGGGGGRGAAAGAVRLGGRRGRAGGEGRLDRGGRAARRLSACLRRGPPGLRDPGGGTPARRAGEDAPDPRPSRRRGRGRRAA